MWLINTSTLKLEYVTDADVYRYAVLSHTWGDGEVTFQDMSSLEVAKSKAGFAKIARTCELAREKGMKYAWVDTCCINKESSAELTEAINSMFEWYKKAFICFAYLSDLMPLHGPDQGWLDRAMQHCRWFRRGWTLQELLAPEAMSFFDRDWNFRGTRSFFKDEIADITGIDKKVLDDPDCLHNFSVAQRMSWAALRETTRDEDMAYCLLGIFDVNMPMLYGEGGTKAFFRLQEEIIKASNDLTLFAWTTQPSSKEDSRVIRHTWIAPRGILARTPREFAGSRNIERVRGHITGNTEFAMTNNGLRISTYLGESSDHDYIFDLRAVDKSVHTNWQTRRVGLRLMKTPTGFARRQGDHLFSTDDDALWTGRRSVIYIRKELSTADMAALPKASIGFEMVLPDEVNSQNRYILKNVLVKPQSRWDPHQKLFMVDRKHRKFLAYFDMTLMHFPTGRSIRLVVFIGRVPREVGYEPLVVTSLYNHSEERKQPTPLMEQLEQLNEIEDDVDLTRLFRAKFSMDLADMGKLDKDELQRLMCSEVVVNQDLPQKTKITISYERAQGKGLPFEYGFKLHFKQI